MAKSEDKDTKKTTKKKDASKKAASKSASKAKEAKSEEIKPKKRGKKQTHAHGSKDEVFFVLGLGFAIFLVISLHTNLAGGVGLFFKQLFWGLSSYVGFLFPYFFIAIIFAVLAPNFFKYANRIYATCVSLFVFLHILQGIFHLDQLQAEFWNPQYLKSAYDMGTNLMGNGMIGAFLISMLYQPIGIAGLFIIMFLCVITIMIFAFYVKPTEVVEKYGTKAIDKTVKTIEDAKNFTKNRKEKSDVSASAQYRTDMMLSEINTDNLLEEKVKNANLEFQEILGISSEVEEERHQNYEVSKLDLGKYDRMLSNYQNEDVQEERACEDDFILGFDLSDRTQSAEILPIENHFVEEEMPTIRYSERVQKETQEQVAIEGFAKEIELKEESPEIQESTDINVEERIDKNAEINTDVLGEVVTQQFEENSQESSQEQFEELEENTQPQKEEIEELKDIKISRLKEEDFDVFEPMESGISNVPMPNENVVIPSSPVTISEPVATPNYFGELKGSTEAIEVNSKIEMSESDDYEANELKLKFLYENYKLPDMSLLKEGKKTSDKDDEAEIVANVNKLRQTFVNFKIDAKITEVCKGPMITRFEIQPSAGVKVSKIVSLSDDIALGLAATSVRIVAPIPGKSAIGIEIPNKSTSIVSIKDVVSTKEYEKEKSLLKFGLGLDISGEPIIADLSKMPHLLIAGATGSGKSVCVNTIISSILLNAKPDEVKFLMIDPKVVELNVYNGIAHLILPVVTDPKKASLALNWAVNEMTERYAKFAAAGVKDISGYNKKFELEENSEYMPRIVIIIDELSDLMMAAPNQVEEAICRLAQMARACGIHLIVATQRPSVDVITGVIKANIPSRIAFAVSSQIDSRTILDGSGAEKLLGKGDMLYHPSGMPKPLRVQGSFISEEEVEKIVEFISSQSEGIDLYDASVLDGANSGFSDDEEVDELLQASIEFVVETQKASTSLIQRKFRIGYNRAARIMEALEEREIVGPSRGSKPREVLIKSLD